MKISFALIAVAVSAAHNAYATTITYSSDSISEISYIAATAFSPFIFESSARASGMSIQFELDTPLQAGKTYSNDSSLADITIPIPPAKLLTAGGSEISGGFATRPDAGWSIDFSVDSTGMIDQWEIIYFFGFSFQNLTYRLSHTGDDVSGSTEAQFFDQNGDIQCCVGYSLPVGGTFDAGTWTINPTVQPVPIPAAGSLALVGIMSLLGVRRLRRRT